MDLFKKATHSDEYIIKMRGFLTYQFLKKSFNIGVVISSNDNDFFPRLLYHFRTVSTTPIGTDFPSIK